MTDFNPDHIGVGKMLRSRMMELALLQVAEKIKLYGEMISPVGGPEDPHRGRYRESWDIDVRHHGGMKHDRVEIVVKNTAPEAILVEWGTRGDEPYHTVLRAAVEGGKI